MAKCWYCQTSKGKRYCAPIDDVLCPVCCAKNRLKNIECNDNCIYLEGVTFQKKREEEREFSRLIESVPHGKHDDIFNNANVAEIAFEIETLVRTFYLEGKNRITDKLVFESYKKVYQIYFMDAKTEEYKADIFTNELMGLFEDRINDWQKKLSRDKIGQIFLRLMLSIRKISGGIMGEFGYLNYLKNNLSFDSDKEGIIVEDKFGNIIN